MGTVHGENLCIQDFKAAANCALKFLPFRREIVEAVCTVVKRELQEYSKRPSTAKYEGDPLKLMYYNNEELLESAREKLPVTYELITNTSKLVKHEVNKQALAISALLNTWIPRSNFVYTINTLLTVGCCKNEVKDLFHRLGLASHPNTIRQQLECTSRQYAKDILVWKDAIEKNREGSKLLEEALLSQTVVSEENRMDISSVDLSQRAMEKYSYYDEDTRQSCLQIMSAPRCDQWQLDESGNGDDHDQEILIFQDSDLMSAMKLLAEEKLPLYRCVESVINVPVIGIHLSYQC